MSNPGSSRESGCLMRDPQEASPLEPALAATLSHATAFGPAGTGASLLGRRDPRPPACLRCARGGRRFALERDDARILPGSRLDLASSHGVACETAPGMPVRGSGSFKKVVIAA